MYEILSNTTRDLIAEHYDLGEAIQYARDIVHANGQVNIRHDDGGMIATVYRDGTVEMLVEETTC